MGRTEAFQFWFGLDDGDIVTLAFQLDGRHHASKSGTHDQYINARW